MSSYGFADGQEITSWLGVPIDEAAAFALGAGTKVVGPTVLTNFASVIVAVKATGGQVTVKVTQGVSAGPPALQLTESVVVAAGATLFEAFVLFGDSVTIEFDGVLGGTTIDYAIYPANTTTNAQVITAATINVQHNDVLVGAEATIDFEDGGVVFTVSDDGPNQRIKVAGQSRAASVKTAPKAVNNTVAPADLLNGEFTVPAHALGAKGVAILHAWGDQIMHVGSSGWPVQRFLAIFGGVTIFDTGTGGLTWQDNASRWGWDIVVTIENVGAENAQTASYEEEITGAVAGGGGGAFTVGSGMRITPSSASLGIIRGRAANQGLAVDTTVAQPLLLEVVNGVAGVLYETRLLGATLVYL